MVKEGLSGSARGSFRLDCGLYQPLDWMPDKPKGIQEDQLLSIQTGYQRFLIVSQPAQQAREVRFSP
jgi:hypothetical protein